MNMHNNWDYSDHQLEQWGVRWNDWIHSTRLPSKKQWLDFRLNSLLSKFKPAKERYCRPQCTLEEMASIPGRATILEAWYYNDIDMDSDYSQPGCSYYLLSVGNMEVLMSMVETEEMGWSIRFSFTLDGGILPREGHIFDDTKEERLIVKDILTLVEVSNISKTHHVVRD